MDKKELEKKLKDLHIPLPDEERKQGAMRAAMEEYERAGEEAKEKIAGEIKGSAGPERLTGRKERKKLFTGGPVMMRPAFATIGVAIIALAVAYVVMPGANYELSPVKTAVMEEEVATVPATKELKGREFTDEITVSTEMGAKAPAKTRSRPELKKESSAIMASNRVDSNVARADKEEWDASDMAAPAAPAAPSPPLERAVAGREKLLSAKPVAKRAVGGFSGAPAMLMEATEPALDRREYAGRDRFERLEDNPVKTAAEEPVSTFSIDVDTASYAFVRRALSGGHLPQKDAVRVEELINYFDYDYELPRDRKKPFKPTVAVYPTPWNPETKLLHIGIKGYDIEKSERPRANLVFLLDVSGSMSSPDKLPLLKSSLKMLVGELRPEDTVAIAVYAGAAGTVLEPTSVRNKGRILAALDRLTAGGSTAGGEGIRLAYSLAEAGFDPGATNRVILATDGDFNVGIRDADELKGFVERKRDTGVYLSVLGFGQGNYNDTLMQKLAQNGNGNAAYIDTLSEARKVLVDEAGSTLFTIAKDVKIQVEFNPALVAEYRLIGYESRMLRREDFRNDKVDAGEVGAGHSVTAIYEITPTGSPARLVEPLRYGKAPTLPEGSEGGEYAFLKVRYKLPDEDKSRLMTTPVKAGDAGVEYGSLEKAPAEARFAASVAAFAQILKGGRYTGEFGYGDVLALATPARGPDTFGYRSEFLNLVRLAESASTMGER